MLGLFAFVLAVQPRLAERPADGSEPSPEDAGWYWLGGGALGLAILSYAGTTLFHLGDVEGTLNTAFTVLTLVVWIGLLARLLVGFLQREAAWVNVTAVFGAYLVAVTFLVRLFDGTAVHYLIDFNFILSDSFRAPSAGAWLIVVAGAAAFAPGTVAFIGQRLDAAVRLGSVARGFAAFGVLSVVQALLSLQFTINAAEADMPNKYVVFGVVSTLAYLAITAGALLAAQAIGKDAPGARTMVLGVAAAVVGVSIFVAILGVIIFDDFFGTSIGATWVGPLVLMATLSVFYLGTDFLKSAAGSTLQTMQAEEPDEPNTPDRD